MVKIEKSLRYAGKVFASSNEWKRGTDVFQQLINDSHNKCYICEDSESELNVDHIKPQSKYSEPEYAFGWDNLLPACKNHCNALKGNAYENIINPTVIDPEQKIRLSLDDRWIAVEPLDGELDTQETVALLNRIYNATGASVNWRVKCAKLRGKVQKKVNVFLSYTENAGNSTYDALIMQEIDRSSPFAAFKREIVRNDPELLARFSAVLL
ncbi:MAG: HNH endonuclease [Fusobacteriaceae bacterium]|jgi:hypothetical protein|nr:HNH endonuclease [Fusobacteriaceae bacterium]